MLDYIIEDAHEGPVYSNEYNSLYVTTVPDYKQATNSIKSISIDKKKSSIIFENANMANDLCLTRNKKSIWIAEQGSFNSPGGIAKLSLDSFKRYSVINAFHGKPFNSPNKIIESKNGILYFSDVHYGYLQGFKSEPKLENAIYAYNESTNKIYQVTNKLKMPHGIALSPDESILYAIDNSMPIDGQLYDKNSPSYVYALTLSSPYSVVKVEALIKIPKGVYADGMITDESGNLIIAMGKFVKVFTKNGELITEYKIPNGKATNIALSKNKLFVTADTRVYSIDYPMIKRNEQAFWYLWNDKQGRSHTVRKCIKNFKFLQYSNPTKEYHADDLPKPHSVEFVILPPGWKSTLHNTPSPQWVIVLSGVWSTETSDGVRVIYRPGDVHFGGDIEVSDQSKEKQGHISSNPDQKNETKVMIIKSNGFDEGQINSNC